MLTGTYDGLLVPGTVAAFQAEGTRGFVLTLSASRQTHYAIDPRFPLFQQRLKSPKKSHEALAVILGHPELIQTDAEPHPSRFSKSKVDSIAQHWLRFNSGYTEVSGKHFAKYAKRLGEAVVPENRSGPEYILPPYTVGTDEADPWWKLSTDLWKASVQQARDSHVADSLVRVVATSRVTSLERLLGACNEQRLVVWVSALDELDAGVSTKRNLATYGRTIASASREGKQLFALYGGFFSVLMSLYGLQGSSHGIGYGEARNWVELPQSGPPPTRYYLPKAHRYISQDLASVLHRGRNSHQLAVCDCDECHGRSPAELDYHALMRHSVRCRHKEITDWDNLTHEDVVERLRVDAKLFEDVIGDMDVPRTLRRQADQCYPHLRVWAEVLQVINGS
jgi:hypothetical protein